MEITISPSCTANATEEKRGQKHRRERQEMLLGFVASNNEIFSKLLLTKLN